MKSKNKVGDTIVIYFDDESQTGGWTAGIHNFTGPEMGILCEYSLQKSPAEHELPASAQEVEFKLRNCWFNFTLRWLSLNIHHCLIGFSHHWTRAQTVRTAERITDINLSNIHHVSIVTNPNSKTPNPQIHDCTCKRCSLYLLSNKELDYFFYHWQQKNVANHTIA